MTRLQSLGIFALMALLAYLHFRMFSVNVFLNAFGTLLTFFWCIIVQLRGEPAREDYYIAVPIVLLLGIMPFVATFLNVRLIQG